jgi:hypothetical protein
MGRDTEKRGYCTGRRNTYLMSDAVPDEGTLNVDGEYASGFLGGVPISCFIFIAR